MDITVDDVRTLVAAVEYYHAIAADRIDRPDAHVDHYLERFIAANKPSRVEEALSRAREHLETHDVEVPPRLEVVRYP